MPLFSLTIERERELKQCYDRAEGETCRISGKHKSVREDEEQSQNGWKERASERHSSREETVSSSMSADANQQALNAF